MNNSMDQLLHLSQTLQLSPALLQSMKILQMNTQELSDYLGSVMEENPTLEEDHNAKALTWKEFERQVPWLYSRSNAEDRSYSPEGITPSEEDSLPLFLRDQISRLGLDGPMAALLNYLAELLDDNGYLLEDDLEDLEGSGVPREMLEQAISLLQSLEPTGIGARSLKECLTIQLKRLPGHTPLSLILAADHLEALSMQSYITIARLEKVPLEEVEAAAALIRTLEPYPGRAFAPPELTVYIRPDAWVSEVDGNLQVFSNQWDLPALRVSAEYSRLLKESRDPQVKDYLTQKMKQAQWILHCVSRRQATLLACLEAMVAKQQDFFSGKAQAPAPMLQYEVAEEMGMHPSTVSRTIRNKYLECRQGLFPLAYFFSRPVGRGLFSASETALKQEIASLIRRESPEAPLSDQAIAGLLSAQGTPIARRTVAKYRGELGLPSSYRRKSSPG